MKKFFVLFISVVFGAMISCTPTQKESKSVEVQEQNQVQQTMIGTDTLVLKSDVQTTVTAVEPTSAQPTTVTPPDLNPPHGQPFHRCDIPVGSPLNAAAAPAKPATPSPAVNRTGTAPTLENAAKLNNTQPNNNVAPATAGSTPPKLNPPHGQPFHRCDIAVGSPLPQN